MEITESLKQEFETFCLNEFPGKIVVSNKGNEENWFFVQAGSHMKGSLHYEFHNNRVHLHIEGKNRCPIRDYLLRNIDDSSLKRSKWGLQNCQWTLDTPIKSFNDLTTAFKLIRKKIEPTILRFEREMNNYSNSIYARIRKVADIITQNICIPDYQRPYKWSEVNVQQLLDDISQSMNSGKKLYRIGSVILHDNLEEQRLDIVDGQQRLTTIALLLYCLDGTTILADQLEFGHSDSFVNIKKNKAYIDKWLDLNGMKNSVEFKNYLLNHCEFVEVIVDNLSEAFQMFDSQNGRGKELEAYNLLKAYHIRAMEQDLKTTKINCDKRWEAATMFKGNFQNANSIDLLKQVFVEQLYRTRLWSRSQEASEFTKKEISEFKGFTLDKNNNIQYPYQNTHLLQYITGKFYESVLSGMIGTQSRFKSGDAENINPFVSINQSIINGKAFFDYIETYIEIYKRIFIDLDSSQLKKFKAFYREYCLHYEGASRTGDQYLREVYKSLVLIVFDKFGEEGLNTYYELLYAVVYKKRLELAQVKYATVSQFPAKYFAIIQNANTLSDLSALTKHALVGDKNFSNAHQIEHFFNTWISK